MPSLASLGARERCRTLVAQDGAIWIWPGIMLTLRCGREIIPASNEVIRFWVTRLHGPDALYKDLPQAAHHAAYFLTFGSDAKAQDALDRLGLFALSHDGAAVMKAVACELGGDALNLPVQGGPRTWDARDIAQHQSFFKEALLASRPLAKGVIPVFDPAKHPRWAAGAPDSQGGRFAPSDEAGASVIPVAAPNQPGSGHNGGPPLEDPAGRTSK